MYIKICIRDFFFFFLLDLSINCILYPKKDKISGHNSQNRYFYRITCCEMQKTFVLYQFILIQYHSPKTKSSDIKNKAPFPKIQNNQN